MTPSDELLQEIKALRADIQALPERITSAFTKKVERFANWLGFWIVLAGLIGFIGRWLLKR